MDNQDNQDNRKEKTYIYYGDKKIRNIQNYITYMLDEIKKPSSWIEQIVDQNTINIFKSLHDSVIYQNPIEGIPYYWKLLGNVIKKHENKFTEKTLKDFSDLIMDKITLDEIIEKNDPDNNDNNDN